MPRTKDPNRENKDFIIRVRVSPREHEEFLRRTKEQGYRTVSQFVRSLIQDKPQQDKSNTEEL